MGAPRILPDNATLIRWAESGMTHEQIAEEVYRTTGHRVARSTVSVALHRAGVAKRLPRYEREIPWVVKSQHAMSYPARMLRDLGRIRAGNPLPAEEKERFDSWWKYIVDEDVVVCYDPDNGFFYAPNELPGDCPDGTPIRPGYSSMPD